ncbi:MAG: 2-phospho-L-lactate guanylyltransferase [Actinomycetes bacterium]
MRADNGWDVVLPVKGGAGAKSRTRLGEQAARLALAMASDCLDAVLATPAVRRALVVTDDAASRTVARAAGALVVGQSRPDHGLNGAVRDGLAVADGRTAVLLADLPCLTPGDLEDALDAAETALAPPVRSVFVPDADGEGTVLLAARRPELVSPRFGTRSASAHARSGAVALEVELPRLRRDVDTLGTLRDAVELGVGPRTAATLDRVQTTVLTFDPATRKGTVVTDGGTQLDLAPDALEGSGLRHLRPGQRVTCDAVAGDPGQVTAVRINGISAD